MLWDFNSSAVDQAIEKERWWNILQHFTDVLHVNIFIVDAQGKVVLAPSRGKYGARILENPIVGIDTGFQNDWLEKFKQRGFYLEYQHAFELNTFAIPIKNDAQKILAYLIAGPVILNKRLDNAQYEKKANELKVDAKLVLDSIGEIRVMTFMGIKSILDLLDEVTKYVVHLTQQRHELLRLYSKAKFVNRAFEDEAEKIFTTVRIEELLSLFLDMALNVTNTECGSIMLYDPQTQMFTIRVSRGMSPDIIAQTCIKLGEGIAGLAAQENKSFVIEGAETPSKDLESRLTRPEIKRAFVLPMSSHNRLLGVVNLHTKINDDALAQDNLNSVHMLSKIAATAIDSYIS